MKRIIKLMFVAMMLQTKAPTWENVLTVYGNSCESCMEALPSALNSNRNTVGKGRCRVVMNVLLEKEQGNEIICEFARSFVNEVCGEIKRTIESGYEFYRKNENGVIECKCGFNDGELNEIVICVEFNAGWIAAVGTRVAVLCAEDLQFEDRRLQEFLNYVKCAEAWHPVYCNWLLDCCKNDKLTDSERLERFKTLRKREKMDPRGMYFTAASFACLFYKLIGELGWYAGLELDFEFLHEAKRKEDECTLEVIFDSEVTINELKVFFRKLNSIKGVILSTLKKLKQEEGKVRAGWPKGFKLFTSCYCPVMKEIIELFRGAFWIKSRTIVLFIGSLDKI